MGGTPILEMGVGLTKLHCEETAYYMGLRIGDQWRALVNMAMNLWVP
jgi:hypothetical protein